MAIFDPAFQATMDGEGREWECVAGDHGGETVWGIARNPNPGWQGWPLVDAIKTAHPGVNPTPFINADARVVALISIFYREAYWQAAGCDQIQDQALATKLMKMAVNMGVGKALTWLQRAYNVRSWDHSLTPPGPGPELKIDGHAGPMTLAAVNAVPPARMLRALQAAADHHYWDICETVPSQRKFADGWLASVPK